MFYLKVGWDANCIICHNCLWTCQLLFEWQLPRTEIVAQPRRLQARIINVIRVKTATTGNVSKVSHLLPTCWVFRGSRIGSLCIVPTGHSAWRGYEEVSLKLLQIHTHSPSEPPRARGPKRKKPPQSTLTIHYEPWSTLRTVRRTTNSTKWQTLQQSAANDKLYKTTNSTKRQTLQSNKLYTTANSTKQQTVPNDKLYKTANSTKRQTQQSGKL